MCFATRELPQQDRLPTFRQLTASLYEVWPLGEPEAFAVEAGAYHVNNLVFSQSTFSPTRFSRGPEQLRTNGSNDFLVLHEQLVGQELLTMEHSVFRLLPGNIYLRDWSLPFESQATAMQLRSVVIPRERLGANLACDAANPVLSWSTADPEGRVLQRLWSELAAILPTAELAGAETVCEGFLGFLGGILGDDPGTEPSVTQRAMERYLLMRLQVDVSVDDLCRHFHTSRSTVYRLFEPHGGVLQYLHQHRLKRCFDELRFADPRTTRVADVAASWRYFESSTFSRRFRACFGVSPSQVLGSARPGDNSERLEWRGPGDEPGPEFAAWFEHSSRENTTAEN